MAKTSLLLLGILIGFVLSAAKPSWAKAINEKLKTALNYVWGKIQFWK